MKTIAQALPMHLSASSIERVDLDRRGSRVLTLCDHVGLRWWVESDAGWTPTGPLDDGELPIVRVLHAELARSGSRIISWKPGRRLTLVAERDRGPVVLKAHRRGGFERALAAHRIAQSALGSSEWTLAPLVAERSDLACLEFAFVAGAPLELALESAALFFRLGAGLRRLQEAAAPDSLPTHTVLDEQRVVEVMQRRAQVVQAELPAGFDEALGRLGASALITEPGVASPCHRDLHDGQILHAGTRLTCLDFDLLCFADPALDAANLVAHLQLRAMQGALGATDASALGCARAFLEGLDRDREPGFGARLCWYQASTFLRLAAVHSMRPRWMHLAPGLLALAARCMEDLERA